MSYIPDKADPEDIIDHLREILHQVHYSNHSCDLCGWIDYIDNFKKYHEDSEIFCCKFCVEEAKALNLKLCGKKCEENDISDSEDEGDVSNSEKEISPEEEPKY